MWKAETDKRKASGGSTSWPVPVISLACDEEVSAYIPAVPAPCTFRWDSLTPALCVAPSFEYMGLNSMLPPVLAICQFALRFRPSFSFPATCDRALGQGRGGMHCQGGLAHWLLVMLSHWEVLAAD